MQVDQSGTESGVLEGRRLHTAEWSVTIPRDFPFGQHAARIGVWERVGASNQPVKEKLVLFSVTPARYRGSPGASTVVSNFSGGTGTSGDNAITLPMIGPSQPSPLVIVSTGTTFDERVQQIEVRYHRPKKTFVCDARFYYVIIRNEGEKTIEDVRLQCDGMGMLIVPYTLKSSFGIDLERYHSFGPTPSYADPLGFLAALCNDQPRVKDSIPFIHPSPDGERVLLFLTLKGMDDLMLIPAETKFWYNAYGGIHNTIPDNPKHERRKARISLLVTARDITPIRADFDVMLDDWKKCNVTLVNTQDG